MKYLAYIFVILTIITGIGCTDNFDELDRPKTSSNEINPDVLFTRTLVTGSGLSVGVWQLVHQTSGSVYAQHFANINPDFTSDNFEPGPGNTVWDWYYARAYFASLNLNYHVLKLSREQENPVKEAIARIWNVYMVQLLTDMYGDIPYSEAFESIKPKFDDQETIYFDLMNELAEATDQLKTNSTLGYESYGQADVLYQGNATKWIRFANTLGMRIALRASNVANAELTQVFFNDLDEGETMQSNEDMAKIIPDAGGPTYHVKNPISYVYGWQEIRISETLMNFLNGYNDPRTPVFAEPNEDGEFIGLRNGQPGDSLGLRYNSYYKPHFCNIGEFFIKDSTPHYLITYAEACFLKAEAAEKGLLAGNAQTYYEAGIRASLEQFEITDETAIADYLAGQAAFDAGNALEQIYTQRWIALFPNGQEAWSVVRRTGYPEMLQPVYTFPGNEEMPRRVPYPTNERRYNEDSYNAAVERMGGDSQYTKIWWDEGN